MSNLTEFDEIIAEYEAGARKSRILNYLQLACFALLILTMLAFTVYATVYIPEMVEEILKGLATTEV